MHPIFTQLGGRPIGTFAVCAALGLFVTGGLTARAGMRARLDVGAVFVVLAGAVTGGFAGAWLTFGAVELARTGSLTFLERGGGIVLFGALPGLLAGSWLADRIARTRLPLALLLDLSVPAIACGHAIARLGCFFAGCCYGAPFESPWSIAYTHPLAPVHDGTLRHPAPLYESAGQLALATCFAIVPLRKVGDGARAAAYFASYAVLRSVVELTRGDAVRGVWTSLSISTSQIFAAVVGAFAIALLVRTRAFPREPR